MVDALSHSMPPNNFYYHKGYCWVKIEINDHVIIGLDEFFIRKIGEIVNIELPFEGEEINEGKTCGKVQSSKKSRKIIAPISGEIMNINVELENDKDILNKDPFGKGWLMKVIASNLEKDLKKLIKERALLPWIKKEFRKIKKLK